MRTVTGFVFLDVVLFCFLKCPTKIGCRLSHLVGWQTG